MERGRDQSAGTMQMSSRQLRRRPFALSAGRATRGS